MKMSIVTVVSFVGSSRKGLKIAMARTDGSRVTLTTMGGVSKDGMSFTPSRALKKMLEINGPRATEANKEIGNEHGKT